MRHISELHKELKNWLGEQTPTEFQLQYLAWAFAHDPSMFEDFKNYVQFTSDQLDEKYK